MNELGERANQAQNLVSYHLGLLRRAGVVRQRRSSADARDVYYSLDLDGLRFALEQSIRMVHPGLQLVDQQISSGTFHQLSMQSLVPEGSAENPQQELRQSNRAQLRRPTTRWPQRLGISVEDVAADISLVKEDVGITREDELAQAFNLLADKVHPLALGNVKRITSRASMLARKLLNLCGCKDLHQIDEIINKLGSKLS